MRLFNTYGPGEHYSPYRSVNCRFLYCALRGIPWTVNRGHQRTSTYLTDAVRTLANITHKFKPGETYNVGGGSETTLRDVIALVEQLAGSRLAVHYEPAAVGDVRRTAADTTRIRSDLGWHPQTSLADGLAAQVAAARSATRIAP